MGWRYYLSGTAGMLVACVVQVLLCLVIHDPQARTLIGVTLGSAGMLGGMAVYVRVSTGRF